MRRTIWKFPIPFDGNPYLEIMMPAGAKILCLQTQAGQPHLWASVNPEAEKEERLFNVYGTGHETGTDTEAYVGTWQDGPYVWHLFEVLP